MIFKFYIAINNTYNKKQRKLLEEIMQFCILVNVNRNMLETCIVCHYVAILFLKKKAQFSVSKWFMNVYPFYFNSTYRNEKLIFIFHLVMFTFTNKKINFINRRIKEINYATSFYKLQFFNFMKKEFLAKKRWE